ncbi:MAG: glycosyltransferase family 2 protein [Planctomycetaceae bacterium]
MPLEFDVVIPCFKQAHLLPDAVGSLTEQTHSHWRAFIVNDGSPDNTRDVAAKLVESDPKRIVYLERPNGGLSAARNTGLGAASAEWVHFLDSDDMLAPEFFADQAAAIEKSEVDVSCSGAVDTTLEREFLSFREAPVFSPDALTRLLSGNQMVVHSVVARRRLIIEEGGFDETLRAYEDWDLWMRLAARGCRFASINSRGAIYRRYPNTMVTNLPNMYRNRLAVSRKSRRLCRNQADREIVDSGMQRFRQWYLRKSTWPALKSAPIKGTARLIADVARDPALSRAMIEVSTRRFSSSAVAIPN